jgi:hypothetical protein
MITLIHKTKVSGFSIRSVFAKRGNNKATALIKSPTAKSEQKTKDEDKMYFRKKLFVFSGSIFLFMNFL